jgi:hypothetical protein
VNRKGITLLEVLMAIFIMGIGMVSVFAIFPVAALMMGQAIEKYQINEVVNNTQSNFDADALEFVKNQPNWVFYANNQQLSTISGSFLNSTGLISSSTKYLFLDQAAAMNGRSALAGIPTAKILFPDQNSPATWPESWYKVWVAEGSQSNTYPSFLNSYTNQWKTERFQTLINDRYFTSNFDIELDESGRVAEYNNSNLKFNPVAQGKYSVSFLLEKKPPLDNPLPSRRYMLVYKGRSQTFADFPASSVSAVNPNSVITVQDTVFYDLCKKGDWVMAINNLGERSFHKIKSLNIGSELEVEPKFFYKPDITVPVYIPPVQPNGVYLLSDVIRVIDLGAG